MTWAKISRTVNTEGTTITYAGLGTDYTIESRKRHIPHAAGKDLAEKMSLSDAKEFAELHMKGNNNVQ